MGGFMLALLQLTNPSCPILPRRPSGGWWERKDGAGKASFQGPPAGRKLGRFPISRAGRVGWWCCRCMHQHHRRHCAGRSCRPPPVPPPVPQSPAASRAMRHRLPGMLAARLGRAGGPSAACSGGQTNAHPACAPAPAASPFLQCTRRSTTDQGTHGAFEVPSPLHRPAQLSMLVFGSLGTACALPSFIIDPQSHPDPSRPATRTAATRRAPTRAPRSPAPLAALRAHTAGGSSVPSVADSAQALPARRAPAPPPRCRRRHLASGSSRRRSHEQRQQQPGRAVTQIYQQEGAGDTGVVRRWAGLALLVCPTPTPAPAMTPLRRPPALRRPVRAAQDDGEAGAGICAGRDQRQGV